MNKQIQLVTNAVNGDMVRREEFQGEMHYLIKSATMPDDIVMNGVLYPAEEIEASYKGLDRVHAPLGHPVSDDGEFLSAADPFAIRNYYVGAQVVNVERKNGKIYHDTAINIAAAKQSDRGKRVLDRVEALINGDDTRPIHTSTGIWLNREDLTEPQTNQYGEYSSIARGLVYDHNAILLDEEGAATPDQGTGMAVHSSKGQKVFNYILNAEQDKEIDPEEGKKVTFTYAEDDKEGFFNSLKTFIKSMGFASDNHQTYNSTVNKQTTDEVEQMEKQEMLDVLAEALKPLQANQKTLADKIDAVAGIADELKANSKAEETKQKAELAEKLGIEAEEAEGMSVNTLQKLASKAGDTGEFGADRLGALEVNADKKDKDQWSGYDMNDHLEVK